jgi:hypothetical protein
VDGFRPRTWSEFAVDVAIAALVLIGGTRALIWFLLLLVAIVWR